MQQSGRTEMVARLKIKLNQNKCCIKAGTLVYLEMQTDPWSWVWIPTPNARWLIFAHLVNYCKNAQKINKNIGPYFKNQCFRQFRDPSWQRRLCYLPDTISSSLLWVYLVPIIRIAMETLYCILIPKGKVSQWVPN